MPTEAPSKGDIEETLGVSKGRRWRRVVWTILGVLMLGGSVVAAVLLLRPKEQVIQWREVAIDRGDIVVEVSATGTLEAARSISVGAEVSGRVAEVLVDPNDVVTKGQVLVRLDEDTFTNSLDQAQASLRASGTEVVRARATLKQAKFNAGQAETLAARGVVSESELVAARTDLDVAKATLNAAIAQRKLANIGVTQAKEQLDKAVITSPIDGVVLERSVEPGNTIVAALQAPQLFVIAEDLRSMELELDIDEADVGQLAVGQSATFTVDAWLGREFSAQVAKVYFSPTTSSSVVTYTTELAVDNDELLLRPGMTASADIVTDTREGVLRVPNTALRFRPPSDEADAPGFQFGPPRRPKKRAQTSAVWVLEGGAPVEKEATLGASDGYFTEVTGLAEGANVLIGYSKAQP